MPTGLRKHYTVPLLMLFIGSGFAALVYEVVWFHLLRFTIGASAISLAILLVSFMGGMSIGSGLFHRFVPAHHHPLKVYALLELAIGACGILVLAVLPLATTIYVSLTGYGMSSLLIRALISLLVLSPPTILMGATLPAIARWMETNRDGASRLGLFYGGNIVGAVLGTAIAGFYLLRDFDVVVASAVAVSVNILIAVIGYQLARHADYRIGAAPKQPMPTKQRGDVTVYVAMALSGFTALGAQVIWTRLLSVLLGATVYTFSVILAVFLAGLGIGSLSGALYSRRCRNPVVALAICQAALLPAIAFAGYAIVQEIPFIDIAATEASWASQRGADIVRTVIAVLPGTFLWGASFPLAIAAVGMAQRDPAKAVGRLYALNTVGAIAAVILISVIVIPMAGTPMAQQLLIVTAGLSTAILFLCADRWRNDKVLPSRAQETTRPMFLMAKLGVLLLLGYVAVDSVPPLNPALVGYGRETDRWHDANDYLSVAEGMTASVAVSRNRTTGYQSFHISGKVVASTHPEDMRLQRLLGHMPALIHAAPKSVLIIGFGAGVTAGSFALYDSIERILIVEIEPQVVSLAAQYFRAENYDIRNDPRTEIIYDDARHYLATTQEKFDIITADPVNPWVRGAAALYTWEFFKLCRERLTQDGLITQWVPLYETNAAAVKSEVGTFFEVFPEGTIWNSQSGTKGYDLILMAGNGPITVNAKDISSRLASNGQIAESTAAVNVLSAWDILKSFAGQRQDVDQWLRDYQPNRDRSLRLEYLAGRALDVRVEQDIYASMTSRLSFPETLFVLNTEEESRLRRWFKGAHGSR